MHLVVFNFKNRIVLHYNPLVIIVFLNKQLF